MTDQTIPADLTQEEVKAAREWATDYLESSAGSECIRAAARVILNDLAAPPRPTLADMTPEDRAACRWMQADVKNHRLRYVIANPHDKDGEVTLLDSDGGVDWVFPEYVTPRPDLPRWEWPGTEKPAPAPALPDGWRLANHPDLGRVMVTKTTPNRDGDEFIVTSYTVGGYTLVHTKCLALDRAEWRAYSNWGLPNIVDLSNFETGTPKFGVSWSAQGTQSSSNTRAYVALLMTAANVADVFTRIAANE